MYTSIPPLINAALSDGGTIQIGSSASATLPTISFGGLDTLLLTTVVILLIQAT